MLLVLRACFLGQLGAGLAGAGERILQHRVAARLCLRERELDALVVDARSLSPAADLRVASLVEAGMVFVNNLDWADAELPFGGIKHSGYGHELGRLGIQAFVNTKMVHVGALPAPL